MNYQNYLITELSDSKETPENILNIKNAKENWKQVQDGGNRFFSAQYLSLLVQGYLHDGLPT